MLDGNILDDQPVRDVLLDLKKENVDSVRLVVDSGQILVKCAVLPKVSHKQILQFVKDEFIDVESQYTDLLYDYAIIKDKVEGKGLSTEDYTTQEKNKLASLQNYNDDEVRELISALNLRLTTLEGDYEALEARVAALETPAA